MVDQVVAIEGPVHVEEVVARIRTAWDLQRSGGRIHAAVEHAITLAIQSSRVEVDNRFLSIPGATITVRDRSGVTFPNLRKPEMFPPAEVKAGVLQIVRTNLGRSQDQVVAAIVRLLGFRASSAQLRDVVQSAINDLIEAGMLEQQGDCLIASELESADFSRSNSEFVRG